MQYHMSNYLKALQLSKKLEEEAQEATRSKEACDEKREFLESIPFTTFPQEIEKTLKGMDAVAEKEYYSKEYTTALKIMEEMEKIITEYREERKEKKELSLKELEIVKNIDFEQYPRIIGELEELLTEARVNFDTGDFDDSLSHITKIKDKIGNYSPVKDILDDLYIELQERAKPREGVERIAVKDFLDRVKDIFQKHKTDTMWPVGIPFTGGTAMLIRPVITTDINGNYFSGDAIIKKVLPKQSTSTLMHIYINTPEEMHRFVNYSLSNFLKKYEEDLQNLVDSKKWRKEWKRDRQESERRLLSYTVNITHSSYEFELASVILFPKQKDLKPTFSFEYSKTPEML